MRNSAVKDHYVRRQEKKESVASSDKNALDLKLVISQIQNSAEQINFLRKSCYAAGSLAPTYGVSETCNPKLQQQIQTLENSIFEKIGNYLQFGGGLSVGAGEAIYTEIMGIGSDVVELADGTTLQAFENNLGSLKAKLSEYIVNGQIDYTKIKNSLVTGGTAIEQEISSLITGLPDAMARLDAYHQGYYAGMIGGGVVLEFVNPAKKLKLITRGFSAGRWASTARYIIDSAKAGHTGAKMVEIAEKLRSVPWSKVNKPDMSKIIDQKLKNFIGNLYKDSSTYGNGSTADAIRYELTTGLPVEGRFHSDKGLQTLTDLENHISTGLLTGSDKNIATELIRDLRDALQTK